MELRRFQIEAMSRLMDAMNDADHRDIVFKSPTGSGKTIVLTRFMSEFMRGHNGTVFVWLTPGEGNLEEQSKEKMDRYSAGASTKLLSDVMTGGFAAGDAVFINWQKLNKDGNNALKDGERTNFLEWIEKARNEGLTFKVIIDESHHSFTAKTESVVEWFGAEKIIRASATPNHNPAAILVEVQEEDVIASGLIKKVIHVNSDFPMEIDLMDDKGKTCYLLEKAWKKREELVKAFVAEKRKVNPLMIVQLPNNSDALLETVEDWFSKKHIDVAGGTFAVWLANRKDNVEGLSENDGPQMVVAIKQAVATGWDCPRAHILVKLREKMDERFEVQTIGRIRRMPEACHYGNDLLDGCYLYTFDERFTAGVIGSVDDLNVGVRKLIIKSEHKKLALVKEQRTMVSETRDPQLALSVISNWFKRKYKLVKSEVQIQGVLEASGYVFGEDVVSSTVSGDASTIGGLKSANRSMNVVSIRVPVNTHRHGREFHHCIGEIGAASALPYDEMRTIVYRVFGTKPSDVAKCLRLEAKELYAFVINNVKRLRDDVGEAMSEELNLTKDSGKVSEKEFLFPQEWFCAYDTNARNKATSEKNVYAGYPLAAATAKMRSKGEVKFEKWCEKSDCVEWYYRNGDKGDEYFSIVYSDNSGHQRLFYPDYIMKYNGKTWIVEVKGGWTAGGKSENIDEYAEKKATALRAYCQKHGVQGGFVCYDESEDELLLNEWGYSEDLTDKSWKPLS